MLDTNFKEAANSSSEKISSIFPTGNDKGPFKRKIAGFIFHPGGDRGGSGRFGQRGGRYNRNENEVPMNGLLPPKNGPKTPCVAGPLRPCSKIRRL